VDQQPVKNGFGSVVYGDLVIGEPVHWGLRERIVTKYKKGPPIGRPL
jgi:hypothetical protein